MTLYRCKECGELYAYGDIAEVVISKSKNVGGREYICKKCFEKKNRSDFMKDFTKKDLKNGDVVKKRDGAVEIVCVDTGTLITTSGYNELDDIRIDLTSMNRNIHDIVAVRRPTHSFDCQFDAFECERGTLIYERKEVEEMTLEEVCKALGKEIKIVKK